MRLGLCILKRISMTMFVDLLNKIEVFWTLKETFQHSDFIQRLPQEMKEA